MVTPNQFVKLLADLTTRYKGDYAFRDEKIFPITALNLKHLPTVAYFEENATVGESDLQITFNLSVIRSSSQFLQCMDIAGMKNGTAPIDFGDYEFIEALLGAVKESEAGCKKKWKIINGGKAEKPMRLSFGGGASDMYIFTVSNIIASAQQVQYNNYLSQFFKP
jgi:hypothetical protein